MPERGFTPLVYRDRGSRGQPSPPGRGAAARPHQPFANMSVHAASKAAVLALTAQYAVGGGIEA